MSSSEYNKAIREFANMLKSIPDSKTSPYDTQAEVLRVDGNTAWVHIPGGVDETPVEMAISAKEGDTVQVRISGGNAWIYGNHTNPPTDDAAANTAIKKAEKVEEDMDEFEDDLEELEDYIEDMLDDVEEAEEMASFALRSANGKNTVYYSSEEPDDPETGEFSDGDTWFNLSEDGAIYNWDASREEWVKIELGENAIADWAITNAKIYNLDAAKITSGFIDAGRINTLDLVVGEDKTLGDTLEEYDEDIDELEEDIDALEAIHGECSTAAATALKVVTCEGFKPYMGATISVNFDNANTSDRISLKIVNDNGDQLYARQPVYWNNYLVSEDNPVLWVPISTVTFQVTYAGSWEIINKPGTYELKATSSGVATTKYLSIYPPYDLILLPGTKIIAKFANPNKSTSNLNLSIGGYLTFPVYIRDTIVTADEILDPKKYNSCLTFVFNSILVGNNYVKCLEYEDAYSSETARRYITYIDEDNGVHVHDGSHMSDYAQLNSDGMTVYKDDDPVAFFGDFVALSGDPNDEGNINTVITSSSMAIQSGDDPIFSVQSTGESVEKNNYALKTAMTSTIFSSAKSASYTETKTWKIRLKPQTYRVTLSGYTTGGGYISFTVGTGSYPITPVNNMAGSHGNSVNTLTIRNGTPTYVVGTTDISEVEYTVQLTAKRDSGTSTAATKRINWASVGVYYISNAYTADIVWNGNVYSDVGKNIYVNGGRNYTDSDGPNLTTDYSIGSAYINQSKSIGWIDLYDGVYVVVVRARYEPTSNGACHTWIQFGTKQDDATCSQTCYNVKTSGYLWNQHHATFIAYPLMVDGNEEEETGKTRYYVTGRADVAGKWIRSTGTAAFQIRALKIR